MCGAGSARLEYAFSNIQNLADTAGAIDPTRASPQLQKRLENARATIHRLARSYDELQNASDERLVHAVSETERVDADVQKLYLEASQNALTDLLGC